MIGLKAVNYTVSRFMITWFEDRFERLKLKAVNYSVFRYKMNWFEQRFEQLQLKTRNSVYIDDAVSPDGRRFSKV